MIKQAMSVHSAMIIAALSFTLAFAQDEPPQSAPAAPPAAEVVPEETAEAAAPAAAASGESVASEETAAAAPAAAAAEAVAEEEEEEEEEEEAVTAPSFMTPEPTEPAPETEYVEEVPEFKPVAEKPVKEKQAKVKKEKPPKAPKPPKEPRAPREGPMFAIGARAGIGMSGFQGHMPVITHYDTLYNEDGDAIQVPFPARIDPMIGFTVGATFSYALHDIVTLAAEGLYTYYSARGEVTGDYNDQYKPVYKAVISLHSLEFPILARVHLEELHDIFDLGFAKVYADAGLMLGVNMRSTAEIDEKIHFPFLNNFAFGPLVGAGLDMNGTLLGVRFGMNVLEYADRVEGRPWYLHLTVARDIIKF